MSIELIKIDDSIKSKIVDNIFDITELGIKFFSNGLISPHGVSCLTYLEDQWSELWYDMMRRFGSFTSDPMYADIYHKILKYNKTVASNNKYIRHTKIIPWTFLRSDQNSYEIINKTRAEYFKGMSGIYFVREVEINSSLYVEMHNFCFSSNSLADTMSFLATNHDILSLYIENVSKYHTDNMHKNGKEIFKTDKKILLK